MTQDRPEQRRQGTMAPFIAAVAVLAVIVAAIVFWPRSRATHPDSTACPKSFPTASTYWVPKKAQTSDPGKALVPSGLPNKAVVCGYERTDPLRGDATSTPLTGSKQLRGDPRAVVTALRANPTTQRECTLDLQVTDRNNYLLALSYDGRVVWVSIPGNHCDGASNGTFRSPANLRVDAVQALLHGVWPTDPSLTGMCDDKPATGGPARLGPATSVSVCLTQGDRLQHVYRFDSLPGSVVAEYNATATTTPCAPGAGSYVAKVGQSGGDATLVGSTACVAGPGGRYVSGSAAARLSAALTTMLLAAGSS